MQYLKQSNNTLATISIFLVLPTLIFILLSHAKASGDDHQPPIYQNMEAPSYLNFGKGGQVKMLYDRRQRPQSVFLKDKVFIVYNAGGTADKAKSPTKPMANVYGTKSRTFSQSIILGPASKDHHYGPVIWADNNEHLHVLFGCHRTPGTHLITQNPADISSWKEAPQIAPSISYPTFYRIYNNQELVYYRTAGHISSWTYRISKDDGKTWAGPQNAVTDLDIKGRTHWSSYHTVLPSKDGRFLHVAFMAYDDNRDNDPKRFYNPRYKSKVSNEWKYNLYYLKIDLQTGDVFNDKNDVLKTPIDINYADTTCRIWDTEWRGAGVPPTLILDNNGGPAFLHVLSGETIREHHYYYVRRENGEWKQTPITFSNHQWNSCHLYQDNSGTLHAFVVTGDTYFEPVGDMDRYGGGAVEEWISKNNGDTWTRKRDLTPSRFDYPGWKYNNVQPVTKPDGSIVNGKIMFYVWKNPEAPKARGFLLDE
jgi:hypothetical protein